MRTKEEILAGVDTERWDVDSRGDEYNYTDMELVAIRAIAEALFDIRDILNRSMPKRESELADWEKP